MIVKSNVLAYVISTTAIFLLIVVFLLTAIELVAFDTRFYRNEYRKLDRPTAIGISEEELMEVTRELLGYIKGKRPDLNITATIKGQERPVFNQREIDHMIDVRVLFERGYILRTILVIALFLSLLVLYYIVRMNIFRYLFRSFVFLFIFLFVVFGILYILINMDFTRYWGYFHYIFFDNDLWQLDPRADVLIQMVPEKFFYDMVVRIMVYFITGVVVMGALLGYLSARLSGGKKYRLG
ncbi:MAG: TIGR01906 family membrane protein [Clostridiales bacterium]|nr:TIGR01906 family membrane protein [Clostridiales bacterium]